jgi:serpin B
LETPEFQLLELPYQRNAASMLILLPRQAAGLQRLEQELSAQQWSQWSSRLPQVPGLQVNLPRFKLHSQYTLNATLQAMGIRDAFDQQRADFSQMVSEQPEGPLAISTVVHKAFCEVNEEGTEAAAATGVAIAVRSAAEEPKVFRADRPFLFAIRHNPTGSLLFLGRVNDPNA